MRAQRHVDLALDGEGHLADAEAWNEDVARRMAGADGIVLGGDHWLVLNALRRFYAETGVSPSMRPLVRLLRERGHGRLASSIALLGLFSGGPGNPDSPATIAARIAGLPRPDKCL